MSDFDFIDLDDDEDGIEFLEESNEGYDKTINVHKKEDNKPVSFIDEFFSFARILIVAVVLAFLFTRFIIVNAQVPSGSMNNTIIEKDRLIGFRLAYLFSEPKRGDIVIFKYPDDEKQTFVKRIIGEPGDVVQIYGGKVYVNGEELSEDYIKEPMEDDGTERSFVVPQGHYFMLGDNRNNSKDSRYWNEPFVAKKKIIAKVSFRYYSGAKGSINFSKIK